MKNEELEKIKRRTDQRIWHYIGAANLAWAAFLYWLIFG